MNLIFLIISSVLIPVYLILKLVNYYKKDQIKKINVLRVYGFFYIELKPKHFYWDFLLMAIVNNFNI